MVDVLKESKFDIIGDIHGCAEGLIALLEKLGYSRINGVYQHPERKVIYLGDFVDRGPSVRETLQVVRSMVDRGHAKAVMGNHEYNAITYMTPARKSTGKSFLRERTERNTYSIQETLDQFKSHPDEWLDYVEWFAELPLYIENEDFRVVHACWDRRKIEWLMQHYPSGSVDMDFIHKSADMGTEEQRCIDRLISGTDLRLPGEEFMESDDGIKRRYFRTKFWAHQPKTYGDVVYQPDGLPDHLFDRELTDAELSRMVHYGLHERPVFVGHYWLEGTPRPITSNVACLDYSAVRDGKMVAYRMDGETELDISKFIWVDLNHL